jgi:hypothetical protein
MVKNFNKGSEIRTVNANMSIVITKYDSSSGNTTPSLNKLTDKNSKAK